MSVSPLRSLIAAAAIAFAGALGAQAATVNVSVDFNDGVTNNLGGGIKEYIEDGFRFYDARIVGGPCAAPGADKCAALNKHETTVLTRVGGGTFDLTSIWFYLNGKASDGSNSFAIYETANPLNKVEFTQPAYLHNTGYTVALNFLGVTSITFESGATEICTTKRNGQVTCTKNEGNARFDALKLSYTTDDPPPPPIPLPASALLLAGGLGLLGALRRRRG